MLEWDVPHQVVSPLGSLDLNTPGPALASGLFPVFLLKPAPYTIAPAQLRAVADDLSQDDGASIQPPFIPGLTASLKIEYWVQPTWDPAEPRKDPACAADVAEMDRRFMLVANALRKISSDPQTLQQLLWTPTGSMVRQMLSSIFLAAWPIPEWSGTDGRGVGKPVSFVTPYPYATDETITSTAVADMGTAVVTNTGNAEESPVIQAHGPSTEFAITNERTGEQLSYDSSRPGAAAIASGHYAEIDFFAGTVQLDGNPAEDHNLIAGLDPTVRTFWKLLPGAQTIDAAGASLTVLSRNAFV